jgi:multicomponent Na+:H+ antiporter subunit C
VNAATLYGLVAAALVAIGLFGVVVQAAVLRKILAFNLLGGGVFLLFGAVAKRAAGSGAGADPVPQAMVITGLVVAFAATALAVVMALRMHQITGAATVAEPPDDETPGG